MANKIIKNLNGPDRWKYIEQVIGQEPKKTLRPQRFGKHDFAKWSTRQKDAYATAITGIKPDQGKNRDRRAGRTKGRYIKGNII